ncbi:MAG: leucine-rich repeat protein [Bacilli bacterium]|nr:leucine-rich repeat protein [Bacilli bacterium]
MGNYTVAFKLKDGSIKTADIGYKVKEILDTCYQDIVCIVINVPKVQSMEFCNLPELSEVIIESNTFIESYAFLKCPKLEQVTMKDGCKVTIHSSAFLECDELKYIIGCPMNIKVGNFYLVNN